MGVPYFGHGYLEWFHETDPKQQLVVRYVLPWEYYVSPSNAAVHQPDIDGQAQFIKTAKPFTIFYFIRHIPASSSDAITLTLNGGDFQVVVTPDGKQTHNHYLTLVQGYPVEPPSSAYPYTYTLSLLKLATLAEAPGQNPDDWKYEWDKDLPPEFNVEISSAQQSNIEFKRWLGWQASPPAVPWETVAEITNVRRLGMFAIVEKSASASAAQAS